MLNRRSASQDFQLRLQQQRQEDPGEELSEASEDMAPGTPNSVSSYGTGTMRMSGNERERDKTSSGRQNRLSKNTLIESRNVQTLSSNLAMVSSPTDTEFPQQATDTLLSVIAQKEAKIAQLREDLETNLVELTQLKERWSQMMIEERNRQQAEVTASIQEQEKQMYGHSSAQFVSHRLSTTGAGIWGTVVGSVSSISGVSGGISLHNLNALHQQQQSTGGSSGIVSGRSSTSSHRRSESQGMSGSSRPTSPLPTSPNNLSSLNGLNTSSPLGNGSDSNSGHVRKGHRTSLSSLSTCSSFSNGGDGSVFETGHSSQSSISSVGQSDQNTLQMQLQKEQQRESRKTRRESSGLFIPPEEVLVNTGRAIFKGFGSLLDGIRTVVSDVAESDSFQHSRQRTLDMMSGLAQSAADALPLPSHGDIYYHHQRLRLLGEEEDESLAAGRAQQQEQHQQQAKELQRQGRQKEKKEKKENGLSELAGVGRSRSLVRLASRPKFAKDSTQGTDDNDRSLSNIVGQFSVKEEPKKGHGQRSGQDQDEEEASEWNIEDKELLESLELDTRDYGQRDADTPIVVSETGSNVDTPKRKIVEKRLEFLTSL
ncbi:hypothetical protein BGZ65_006493 [Modicella reniformis]|uniref:Uncharacterized protein n=1 Tax=Modicella reniformis TaxID=1440133 RepID=A0A9P6IJS2_9FUNG|nr:hypothetical protein BGZ65_006493 [Modicella reniformis]